MIELFGRLGSGSAVCEALFELTNTPYKLTSINKQDDGSPPPEFFAINPLGQVPAVRLSDGTLLTETGAITIWIADLAHHANLAPATDHPNRATYLRAMFFMATNCYMTALRFYYAHRYSTDETHAGSIRTKAHQHMQREYAILNEMLGQNDFLLGHNMSAADIYLSMLISWEEDYAGFTINYPALAKLNQRVWNNEIVAKVWQRHGFHH